MAKELNEDSGFKVSIKTLIGIGAAMATVLLVCGLCYKLILKKQNNYQL